MPRQREKQPLRATFAWDCCDLLYYARVHGPWPVPFPVTVPTAYAAFPKEILRPPRPVAERSYTNLRRWTEMKKGGHFAALEQPDALARDITAFFEPLWPA